MSESKNLPEETEAENAGSVAGLVRRRPSYALAAMASVALFGGIPHYSSMTLELDRPPRRQPRGRGMKEIERNERGEMILEDHSGKRYIRNLKGTIRRLRA